MSDNKKHFGEIMPAYGMEAVKDWPLYYQPDTTDPRNTEDYYYVPSEIYNRISGTRLIVVGATNTCQTIERTVSYSGTMGRPTHARLEKDKNEMVDLLREIAAREGEQLVAVAYHAEGRTEAGISMVWGPFHESMPEAGETSNE